MKASTGPGKGVRTQGARAGPKGRLPSLASAFLPSSRGEATPSRGATGFDGRVTGSLWLARDGVYLPLRETWRGWRCIWPYTC